MTRIGLISDTHGHIDERILHHFKDVDQIWHAGDFGTVEVSDTLEGFKPLVGVYGNIDGHLLRRIHPVEQYFELEGFKIWMTHIAGRPGRYARGIPERVKERNPDILICGHSHILKIMRDPTYNCLYINPGAAGLKGFHQMRTIVRFTLNKGKIERMEAIELGLKAQFNMDFDTDS